jgi:hypothetical protein
MPRPSTESLMMHVTMNTEKMQMKKISTGRLRRGRFADAALSGAAVAVVEVTRQL